MSLEYVWETVGWSCTALYGVLWDVGGEFVGVRKTNKEGAGKTEIYNSIDIEYYSFLIQCFIPIDWGYS